MATDVIGLLDRYGELLKKQREEDPMVRFAAKLEMIEVEIALSWSRFDFIEAVSHE